MTFVVPNNTFTRVLKNGATMVVERKGHTRRTVLPDAWLFHLKAMSVAEDPLRYIRKFLLIEEDLQGIQHISDEEDGIPEIPKKLYEDELTDNLDDDFSTEE